MLEEVECSLHQALRLIRMISPILQMRDLRPKEIKEHAEGQTSVS